MNEDTIAAISTPIGTGGIGVIRVSGSEAVRLCDLLFEGKMHLSDAKSHTVHFGHIIENKDNIKCGALPEVSEENAGAADSSRFIIDEVLVSVFRAPHSYTTEDVVEIQSHGGIYVMQRILELLFEKGVRPAQAGEFTKRAFLGGRIDLSQAESVMDIISAENERILKNSQRQLSGALSDSIAALRADILHEVAFIEAALDDPEHYDLDGYPGRLAGMVTAWRTQLERLLLSAGDGQLLKDGIRTVIIGKPNVGKSSLLNALTKSDRAIVTDIPGTTRDVLEEKIRIRDISLVIVDTAGIRETDDTVEKIGIDRAISHAKNADLILYVVDASDALDDNDIRIIDSVDLAKTIVLLNKTDKAAVTSEETVLEAIRTVGESSNIYNSSSVIGEPSIPCTEQTVEILPISAKQQTGLDVLYEKISSMVFSGDVFSNDDIFITNLRHKSLLEQAERSLSFVSTSIADGQPEDFFSIDLMDAYTRLGEIIGQEVADDLVEEIFSKFCMGK